MGSKSGAPLPGEDLGLCVAAVSRGDAPSVDDSTSVELNATRFRALGDPTRLRVVQELAAGTRCVCELRERVEVSGPLLSHHLAVLRECGIVTATRRGRWIDYTLDHDALSGLRELIAAQGAGADW